MNKYNKDNLGKAIESSVSWHNVCMILGVKSRTGAQSHLKKRAIELGLDFSHFTGQAWAKGKPSMVRKDALELCKENIKVNSHTLKLKLIRDGYKEAKCEICGIDKWNGENVVLELDHKNSNHIDNRLENLQIICPNCHAQLTRNRKRSHVGMQTT